MIHRRRTARRILSLAVPALLAAALLASCTRFSHPNGTTFCGTHIRSGAMSVAFHPLDSRVPAPVAGAPTASQLPAAAAVPRYPQARYVRTSTGCEEGAVVLVTPNGAARLTIAIRAADGLVTGIGLQEITAPVTVAAWQRGRYLGALVLAPPGG